MAKRRVVITGAAGYVAQRMFKALDERWDVVPIDIRDKTRVTKRSSLLRLAAERALVDFAVATFHAMWSDGPTPRQWMGWVRSFAQFGRMVGGPMALRNSLRLRTPGNRAHYFHCREFNFYDFWEAGRARGIKIANRAFEYFEHADFSPEAQARFVADVAFDGSLAEPLGLYGPALPKLPALPPEQAAA